MALAEKHEWVPPDVDDMIGSMLGGLLATILDLHLEHQQMVLMRQGVALGDAHVQKAETWLEEQMEGVMREAAPGPGPGVRPQQALAAAREAWAIAETIQNVHGRIAKEAAAVHTHDLAAAAGSGVKGKMAAAGSSSSPPVTPATLPTDPIKRAVHMCGSPLVQALLSWHQSSCSRLLALLRGELALLAPQLQDKGHTGTGSAVRPGAQQQSDENSRARQCKQGKGHPCSQAVSQQQGSTSGTQAPDQVLSCQPSGARALSGAGQCSLSRVGMAPAPAGSVDEGAEGQAPAGSQPVPAISSSHGYGGEGGEAGDHGLPQRKAHSGGEGDEGPGSAREPVARVHSGWAALSLEQRLVVVECQVRGTHVHFDQ